MVEISHQFLKDIRDRLRIKHTRFDKEITDLIGEARADLLLGGILADKVNDEGDMLIKRAIATYVKAEFGLDNADAEKYRAAYMTIKKHLMFSKDYTVAEEE